MLHGESSVTRTLVIALGNRDRGDDGVGYEIVDALRLRLGQAPLADDESGLERSGSGVDMISLQQLAPEWLEAAADYEQLVFVDAHVQADVGDLWCAAVRAGFAAAPFTHQVTPSTFLVLLSSLYGRQPVAWIISVRGHRFDFHRGLCRETAQLVEPAVDRIVQLLQQSGSEETNSGSCVASWASVQSLDR